MPENAAPRSTAPATAAPDSTAPGEMSLYVAMLGEAHRRLGWLLEGMMTAQVATVLARLAIPDELAGGPLTAAQLASRAGAAPGALDRLLARRIPGAQLVTFPGLGHVLCWQDPAGFAAVVSAFLRR